MDFSQKGPALQTTFPNHDVYMSIFYLWTWLRWVPFCPVELDNTTPLRKSGCIPRASRKAAVTPVLTHWSYSNLALLKPSIQDITLNMFSHCVSDMNVMCNSWENKLLLLFSYLVPNWLPVAERQWAIYLVCGRPFSDECRACKTTGLLWVLYPRADHIHHYHRKSYIIGIVHNSW